MKEQSNAESQLKATFRDKTDTERHKMAIRMMGLVAEVIVENQIFSTESRLIKHGVADDEPVMRALECFISRHWRKKQNVTVEYAANFLLRVALAHPEELSRWVNSLVNYSEAEGFNRADDDENKLVLSLIAGRKEYRRKRKTA